MDSAISTPAVPAAPATGSLAEALALVDAAPSVREAATRLRERYAPLRVIVVDAFDMRHETPAAVGQRRLLWGDVSDGHCWQVSTDLSSLQGFYVADKG